MPLINYILITISFGVMLSGCQATPQPDQQPKQSQQSGAWQPSTLSEATIAKANAAVLDYRKCLARETNANAENRGDPRDIANTILKSCEDRLPAIKAAYDAENVPAVISERYIRKTRSQGAQSVIRSVEAVHALRSADEEEARNAAKAKQPKSK